jgi:hypothetical protein
MCLNSAILRRRLRVRNQFGNLADRPPAPNSGGGRWGVGFGLVGGGPFCHDAEVVAGVVGIGLGFAPGDVIAEAEFAEVIDRVLQVWARSDRE